MYDGGKIIAGLIILVGLVTFPIYYNMGKTTGEPEPKIDTPFIQQLPVKQCVESKAYMRENHMQILDEWRDSVVRDGDRSLVTVGGRVFEKSLQKGCMVCHSNKKEFCDRCHGYVQAKPYCWDCHLAPEEDRT